METAGAQIQTAEASLRLAQANLADTRVLAPYGGIVLRKLVEAGEVVAAGTPLITLVTSRGSSKANCETKYSATSPRMRPEANTDFGMPHSRRM